MKKPAKIIWYYISSSGNLRSMSQNSVFSDMHKPRFRSKKQAIESQIRKYYQKIAYHDNKHEELMGKIHKLKEALKNA